MFRTILSALVVVVAFGSATQAHAQAGPPIAPVITHTVWYGETTDANGMKRPVAMSLRGDGKFLFATHDGNKIQKVEGTYTIQNNSIKVSIPGQPLITLEVVQANGKQLVTKGQNGRTTWDRLED